MQEQLAKGGRDFEAELGSKTTSLGELRVSRRAARITASQSSSSLATPAGDAVSVRSGDC